MESVQVTNRGERSAAEEEATRTEGKWWQKTEGDYYLFIIYKRWRAL